MLRARRHRLSLAVTVGAQLAPLPTEARATEQDREVWGATFFERKLDPARPRVVAWLDLHARRRAAVHRPPGPRVPAPRRPHRARRP
jgi:hypothetical protein